MILNYRREQVEVFNEGDYRPLIAHGAKAKHVVAFERCFGDRSVIVIVPVLVWTLTEGIMRVPIGAEVWHDTFLSLEIGQTYRNIFTREMITSSPQVWLHEALRDFPIALLERV